MKVAIWAAILALNSMLGMTEEVTPTETTKGCIMRFCDISGGGSTQLFVKVANDEYDDPDTGESQVWGFDPLNKHFDKNHHILFERALAKDFIEAGRAGRKEGAGPCVFKCPLY